MPSATSFVRAEPQSEVEGGQNDSTQILQQHQGESRKLKRRKRRKRITKIAGESSTLRCDDDTLGNTKIVEHENDSQNSWILVDTLYRTAPCVLFSLLLVIIPPLLFWTARFYHQSLNTQGAVLDGYSCINTQGAALDGYSPIKQGIGWSRYPILTISLLTSGLSIILRPCFIIVFAIFFSAVLSFSISVWWTVEKK